MREFAIVRKKRVAHAISRTETWPSTGLQRALNSAPDSRKWAFGNDMSSGECDSHLFADRPSGARLHSNAFV